MLTIKKNKDKLHYSKIKNSNSYKELIQKSKSRYQVEDLSKTHKSTVESYPK